MARANSTAVLKRTVNTKPTEPKLMSVVGQRPPHSKLTTHSKIFRLNFDSRPKQHTRSPNERVAVEATGIEEAGACETDDFVCRSCAGRYKESCQAHSKDLHTLLKSTLKPGSVLTGIMPCESCLRAFKDALNTVDGPKTTLGTGHKNLWHSPRAEIPHSVATQAKNAIFCSAPPFRSRGGVWPGFSCESLTAKTPSI